MWHCSSSSSSWWCWWWQARCIPDNTRCIDHTSLPPHAVTTGRHPHSSSVRKAVQKVEKKLSIIIIIIIIIHLYSAIVSYAGCRGAWCRDCATCEPWDAADSWPTYSKCKYQLRLYLVVTKITLPLAVVSCAIIVYMQFLCSNCRGFPDMASHSVTCHQAEVTFPPLPQPIKTEGCNVELTQLTL